MSDLVKCTLILRGELPSWYCQPCDNFISPEHSFGYFVPRKDDTLILIFVHTRDNTFSYLVNMEILLNSAIVAVWLKKVTFHIHKNVNQIVRTCVRSGFHCHSSWCQITEIIYVLLWGTRVQAEPSQVTWPLLSLLFFVTHRNDLCFVVTSERWEW